MIKHLVLILLLALPASAAAGQGQPEQEPVPGAVPEAVPSVPPPVVPLTDAQLQERYQELTAWLADYRKWEDWYMKYANVPADNLFGRPVGERKDPPDPPAWLGEECRQVIDAEGALKEACEILDDQGSLYWVLERRKNIPGVTYTGNVANDQVQKSTFFQRIHLAGGWVPSEFDTPEMYGVVGGMVGVVEVKRVTLPTIGFFMIRMRTGPSEYAWSSAMTLGISYRMFEFSLPGASMLRARTHLNLARFTIYNIAPRLPVAISGNQTFAGLSLTFRRIK